MKNFTENTQKRFADKKWRFTSGARNLARILENATSPLSVKSLVESLEAAERKMDTATVYRLLERFLEVRLVHRVANGFMPCTDPDNTSDSHHFLLCNSCGLAEEIFLDYQESISKQLQKEKDFRLSSVDLTFYGVCRHCRRK
ncbi:transcriptional repressor [bacterium]|jgi:Fe2+ or Zn2+ uptake regulation protein|nr:transcriptional repressor [bacterium]MBT6831766.1 transcriptional repressor [bacterium]MBT6996589.1 transcriptional repressor [bacterium]MBT7772915.1 transcriptional repressor [bacterium]